MSKILSITMGEEVLDSWIQYSINSSNPQIVFYETIIKDDSKTYDDIVNVHQSDTKEVKEKKKLLGSIIKSKNNGFDGWIMMKEAIPELKENQEVYYNKYVVEKPILTEDQFIRVLEEKIQESITYRYINQVIDVVSEGVTELQNVTNMGGISRKMNEAMLSYLGKLQTLTSKNNTQILSKETVDDVIEQRNQQLKHTIHEKILTGFKTLDEVIWFGGMQKSRLYLIAGKTGAGKSVFSINLVKNFLEQGKSVMLFTLENTAEETMDRLIQCITKTSINNLKDSQQDIRLKEFFNSNDGILDIESVPSQTLTKEMIDTYIQIRMNSGFRQPDVIIIDYLDLMRQSQKTQEERIRLSRIASDLKQLAQERNAIVISPTQVVKSSYKKDKIDLEDINESGGKAHVSDAVMILNGSEENFNDGLVSLFIAKNRHGKAYKSVIFKIDFDKMMFIDTGRIGDIIHDEDDDNSEYYKNTVFTKVK